MACVSGRAYRHHFSEQVSKRLVVWARAECGTKLEASRSVFVSDLSSNRSGGFPAEVAVGNRSDGGWARRLSEFHSSVGPRVFMPWPKPYRAAGSRNEIQRQSEVWERPGTGRRLFRRNWNPQGARAGDRKSNSPRRKRASQSSGLVQQGLLAGSAAKQPSGLGVRGPSESDDLIVCSVWPDPIPKDAIGVILAKRTVVNPDARRPNAANLLESD